MTCQRFKQLRKAYFGQETGGPQGEGDLKKILNMPKLTVKAAKFMIHTGLLGQFEAVNRNEIGKADH